MAATRGDCPRLLPCWADPRASIPESAEHDWPGLVTPNAEENTSPTKSGDCWAYTQPRGCTPPLAPIPRSAANRERESQRSRRRGTPTPLCSRTRVKGGARSCHCSTEAVLQAQYGMAACDGSPELITFPRGAPRKHLLLFTACSARGTGARGVSEGLQVV